MKEKTLEYCFKCDEPTGCAGKADDSHYNEDGEGPFCWQCWCEDENPRLHERVEDLEVGLEKIVSWSKAYPLKIFPKPDFKKAHKILKANGMTLDAISADNMRHVVEGVGKIAEQTLKKET